MKPLILLTLIIIVPVAFAELPVYELNINDHLFSPAQIEIPSGTKVKLLVKNLDASPEEFESYELNREKVVPGKSEIIIYIGPLDPGTYGFFGDFHQDTAQGKLIAK